MHHGDVDRVSVAFNVKFNPAPSHIEDSPSEQIEYALIQGVHDAERERRQNSA